ncbi:hypothetical protein ACFV3R_27795 [Streptomyces sp. NPDC059740]
MYAVDGKAARQRPGRVLLCSDRSVDLLRVNSALCTAARPAHCRD